MPVDTRRAGSRRREPSEPPSPTVLAELGRAIRRMGAQTVLVSKTVADRFALNMSDLEVLDLVVLRGQASAGELAEATGLTTGSMTALIDRLVAAGFAERFDDPADRRRVLVRPRPDAIAPIEAVYADLQAQVLAVWSGFDAHEIETVIAFTTRSSEVAAAWIKSLPAVERPARRRPTRRHR